MCESCRVELRQSRKLEDVCYDIRGPVLEEAKRLEEEGRRIIKLNIGNPAPFGFDAPEEILVDVIRNLPSAQGYSDSQGLLSARTAIVQHYQERGIQTVDVDDIWLGNGVSELITMSLQAMLDDGDEVLVPAPDYPLWTASTVAGRWPSRALPVRRAQRLAAGPRRSALEDHAAHQGDRRHQPEQPDRCGVPDRASCARSPRSRVSTAWS